jgi:hypothetical protein
LPENAEPGLLKEVYTLFFAKAAVLFRGPTADPLRESRHGVNAAAALCDEETAGPNFDRAIEIPHIVTGDKAPPPSPGHCAARAHGRHRAAREGGGEIMAAREE